MNSKDAAVLKALEELGLRSPPQPQQLSSEIQDILKQLDDYDKHVGKLDPNTLQQYLK